jgi:hypothetical protein
MAYVDLVFRLRIFGRRFGGKRRAESHGGPLDERVSRNGPRPTGQDATPSMARGPLSDSRGLPWACRRRLDAAKKLLTDMRGEMKQFYMVMGDFDFVGI